MSLRQRLSDALQLPIPYLDRLARSASHLYKTYSIAKRNGGRRTIHHPSRPLKAVQRWLLHNELSAWPVHPAAHAYRSGRSIRTNAEQHIGCSYLLRMDLRRFFPSIRSTDLDYFLAQQPELTADWETEDQTFFVKLVTRKGELTIGSPTSPHLANVLCYALDAQISEHCAAQAITYTRYADDMYMSAQERGLLYELARYVEELVGTIDCPARLTINRDKTHHASRAGRLAVTGLTLTQYNELSVGRDRKRYLRSCIHKYGELSAEDRRRLAGHLAFVESIEPDFINRLVLKYGADRVAKAMNPELAGEE